MTWTCAAIDHGLTVYPNGKIGPCCQISNDYLKPISELNNPHRFADLKTSQPPSHCDICVKAEADNLPSYRKLLNNIRNNQPGIQFLDIRNTNLCNLKCRYCGPHFSNQWAEELHQTPSLKRTEIDQYKPVMITDSLHWMYFTGGEPMINVDHWNLLEELIDSGRAHKIQLMYNSNLTTVKYKDKDIASIWNQFRSIRINCSIDAVDKPLEYIRSGSDWTRIQNNISHIKDLVKHAEICFTPVISILSLWFLPELLEYAKSQSIAVDPIILTGPDYLALDVIPDQHKSQALELINQIENRFDLDPGIITKLKNLITNNQNQCLFSHTLSHILLLDRLRDEKLFDLLPFKTTAIETVLNNHEYE